MQFTEDLGIGQEQMCRTFQNANFSTFRIDFDEPRHKVVLRDVTVKVDQPNGNSFAVIADAHEARTAVTAIDEKEFRVIAFGAGGLFHGWHFDLWIESDVTSRFQHVRHAYGNCEGREHARSI